MVNTIPKKGVIGAAKGQEGGFLSLIALPLMIKTIPGEGVTRAGSG